MVVQHNLTAMNANRYLGINNNKLSKSLEKLSSGYQINRAGDNAAGLAVSEKMRSQIAGMTQGVKNAQDGISMVQTFEGALTETHSILQRMKTLADQMANGSYDDPIDRTAAQQEFLQLNDELDQIADTDFNGVVVLNGGRMADGAVADSTGLIDYTNQPPRAAKALTADDVNTLDNSDYNGMQEAANNLWDDLGLSRSIESVDITFKYDKTNDCWTISETSDPNALTNAQANLEIRRGDTTAGVGDTATKGHNNGGFSVVNKNAAVAGTAENGKLSKVATAAGANEYANVVLDSSELKDGDTVTIRFTRPDSTNTAPENAAIADGTKVVSLGAGATGMKDPVITVNNKGAAATNYESTNSTTAKAPMTEKAMKSFNGLNGAKVELNYATGAAFANSATISIGGKSLTVDQTTTSGGIVLDDGTKYSIEINATGALTVKDADSKELLKIDTAGTQAGTSTAASKVSFELRLDEAKFREDDKPQASIVDPTNSYSVSKSDAFKKSEAKLTYKSSITLQVGARTKDAVNFTFKYASTSIGNLKDDLNCTAKGLGTDKLNINTQEAANYAIDKIDQAINKVSLIRGTFGAIQNRLEHKIDNLNVSVENLTSAESQIRDTNMPQEMMNFTKNQILAQASQAMLAQANQLPQNVLSLLR